VKKLLLGFAALFAALAIIPLFAAFEAHVINVTARIENALSVDANHIQFGTVFPQEHLKKPLRVALSQSFVAEDRVDDVDYFIRQKPKCGITSQDGTVLDEQSTRTGHVVVTNEEQYEVDCGVPPRATTTGETWGVLPSLCEYLSKEDDQSPDNDGNLLSFHRPFVVTDRVIWNDTRGHLAKSKQDFEDLWTIDLAVPCFGDHCAQDWAEFVHRINPQAGDPNQWVQPIANEHKIFGCDLWVEVAGISLPGFGCADKLDLMLVLDRSGSIQPSELATLKTAAKAFVDALIPSPDGPHIGQTSFATTSTLDLHLTSDSSTIKAAIDALAADGFTNLKEGIELATGELANPGDGHDRPDFDSPDFMVVITDGAPNRPVGTAEADAKAAADAAKAAGTEIFVVGVGTTSSTADYLRDNIASGADHYFDAADYASLQTVLEGLISCKE
jgi:uncharacterized protein YegL